MAAFHNIAARSLNSDERIACEVLVVGIALLHGSA